MQLQRNEILTGLLVIGTIGVIAFLLVLLGAPGLFRPLVTYKVYFDNAAGIKPGAVVMLAGRKIGQVQKLYSPLTLCRRKTGAASRGGDSSRPNRVRALPHTPRFEARVDVQVDKNARLYRDAKAQMIQLGLLGDMAIDFTQGTQESGRAKNGETFAGERTPDLGEAAAKMLEVIKPVANEATNTMKDLQNTAQNLNQTHRRKLRTESRSHPVQNVRRTPLRSDRARQRALAFAHQHRKNQHQPHGERQYRSHPAKPADFVGEIKTRDVTDLAAGRRKHQAIQRDN